MSDKMMETDLYREYWKTAPAGNRKFWKLPVETIYNEDTGEDDYIIIFPDELMEITGWTPDTMLEWIENDDGSFLLKKHDISSTNMG